jgi:hypothetical protein
MIGKKKSPVYGIGINDLERNVTWYDSNGQRVLCPVYQIWHDMLERCYCPVFNKKHPTYTDCSVCESWLHLSNFEAWLGRQDYKGKHLDKDIISPGNKLYSPSTCAFIDQNVNKFITDGGRKSNLPIGVTCRRGCRYIAQCCDPFTGKTSYIGSFNSAEAAHQAWKRKKHEYALVYADQQSDPRVAAALRVRYL